MNIKTKQIIFSIGLIAVIAGITFLPFISNLGIYHDDWIPLSAKVSGQDIKFLFSVDRPITGIVPAKLYYIFGNIPIYWHFLAFGLRIFTAIIFFLILLITFDNSFFALIPAILYVCYPGFLFQTNPITYDVHLIALAFGLLSILLTLLSLCLNTWLQNKMAFYKHFIIFLMILSSCLLLFAYLSIVEYFIGLEIFRVLLVFTLIYRNQNKIKIDAIKSLVIRLVPCFITVAGFLVWRFLIFIPTRIAVNEDVIFQNYIDKPLNTILNVLVNLFNSVLNTTVNAYFTPLINNLRNISGHQSINEHLLIIGFGLIGIAIFGIFLKAIIKNKMILFEKDVTINPRLLIIGLFSVVGTLLPVVIVGRYVDFTSSYSRYTFQSIPAAALLITSAIMLFKNNKIRYGIFSVMVFLSILGNLYNARYFAEKWDYQKQVWSQMTLRVPQIKENTLLMVNLPSGYKYSEGFEMFAPASAIYFPNSNTNIISGEVLNSVTLENIKNKSVFTRYTRTIPMKYDYQNVLLVTIPAQGSCLHIINDQLSDISVYEEELVRQVSPYVNMDMIDTSSSAIKKLPAFFSFEIPQNWCFYYQKASLAKQQKNIEEVIAHGNRVLDLGFIPVDKSEWLPFIEAFLSISHDKDKIDLIIKDMKKDPLFIENYCNNYKQNVNYSNSLKKLIEENIC